MFVLSTRLGPVEALRFAPDGRVLAAGGRQAALELWDLAAPRGPTVQGVRVGRVSLLRYHPTRPVIYAIINGSAVELNRSGGWTRRFNLPHADRLDLSDDGGTLLVAGPLAEQASGHRVAAFDVTGDGTPAGLWADPLDEPGPLHQGLTWLPGTGRFAVAQSINGPQSHAPRVVIRDGRTGAVVRECNVSGGPADQLAASDRALAVAAWFMITVWPEADLFRPVVKLANDHARSFTALAFHPSGRYLAAASSDGTVKLYDADTWALARTFAWDVGELRSVAFSPDGLLAAAGGSGGKVVVWDVDV